eukprot:scaffold1070_cov245-Pinguiococcus_pyrenoidosus.AAC.4
MPLALSWSRDKSSRRCTPCRLPIRAASRSRCCRLSWEQRCLWGIRSRRGMVSRSFDSRRYSSRRRTALGETNRSAGTRSRLGTQRKMRSQESRRRFLLRMDRSEVPSRTSGTLGDSILAEGAVGTRADVRPVKATREPRWARRADRRARGRVGSVGARDLQRQVPAEHADMDDEFVSVQAKPAGQCRAGRQLARRREKRTRTPPGRPLRTRCLPDSRIPRGRPAGGSRAGRSSSRQGSAPLARPGRGSRTPMDTALGRLRRPLDSSPPGSQCRIALVGTSESSRARLAHRVAGSGIRSHVTRRRRRSGIGAGEPCGACRTVRAAFTGVRSRAAQFRHGIGGAAEVARRADGAIGVEAAQGVESAGTGHGAELRRGALETGRARLAAGVADAALAAAATEAALRDVAAEAVGALRARRGAQTWIKAAVPDRAVQASRRLLPAVSACWAGRAGCRSVSAGRPVRAGRGRDGRIRAVQACWTVVAGRRSIRWCVSSFGTRLARRGRPRGEGPCGARRGALVGVEAEVAGRAYHTVGPTVKRVRPILAGSWRSPLSRAVGACWTRLAACAVLRREGPRRTQLRIGSWVAARKPGWAVRAPLFPAN